ncbi:hypothetical protein GCM10010435_65560 [Winogradskya consettensis]|uniref:Methyltransferase domain-containing protein n=1 Tax=Winogradskya consettensis TaxID=113560 RepID=A0A919W0W4_9ACTN|nr:class I SAM-dependent methyltransferase [Actinoplanes consettensis]GIM84862.1 hypothetical protein Aco04nite_93530 [Actinoplanes consettensis]
MAPTEDWLDWHLPYADEQSPLSRRLRLIQHHLTEWLDSKPDGGTIVSVCAGQGHDLIGVLTARPVRAHLIEFDPRNVAAARERISKAGLHNVTVICADAGDLTTYQDLGRADLVLLAGVLGNISDADVRRTIETVPQLCTPGATVIWTRARRAPDLTPAIRAWFAETGFTERAFHAPADVLFTVGVHEFHGVPQPLEPAGTVFRFR